MYIYLKKSQHLKSQIMNDSFHKISLYMIPNIFPISITLTNIFTVLYQYRDQHKESNRQFRITGYNQFSHDIWHFNIIVLFQKCTNETVYMEC